MNTQSFRIGYLLDRAEKNIIEDEFASGKFNILFGELNYYKIDSGIRGSSGILGVWFFILEHKDIFQWRRLPSPSGRQAAIPEAKGGAALPKEVQDDQEYSLKEAEMTALAIKRLEEEDRKGIVVDRAAKFREKQKAGLKHACIE